MTSGLEIEQQIAELCCGFGGLLAVLIAVLFEADLQPWYRHLYTFGPSTALVVLVSALGTVLLVRRTRNQVAFMAHHDLLTGLANRTLFMEKIEEAGARLRRHGEAFTVVMLDLDRFKNVNDTLGHPAGDALLKEMAQRLRLKRYPAVWLVPGAMP